jgi:hypothetical protein
LGIFRKGYRPASENLQTKASSDDHAEMTPSASAGRSFLSWFLIGTAVAAILQFGQARVMAGVPEGLLFAGRLEPAHELVVDELPNTPVFDGLGHDGQIFYAIGLDLRGQAVPDVVGSAAYRYRRILYPALASGLGVLDGAGLLWGMIGLAAVSVGLAAGAIAALAAKLALPTWAPVTVLLNPAIWLSARLLTADNLAFALALLATLAFVNGRYWWALVGLAAAALTKEPYLAFALGLSGFAWFRGERRWGIGLAVASAASLIPWWAYISLEIGNPISSGSTLVPPLSGLIAATRTWPSLDPRDLFYLAATLIGLVSSLWVIARRWNLWSWLAAPWLAVAFLSSEAVWQFGNNAVRSFAPLLTLGILGVIDNFGRNRSAIDGNTKDATAPMTVL